MEPTRDQPIPNGFLLISDAVNRLANGMWGGLPRPVAVRDIKRKYNNQTSKRLNCIPGVGPLLATAPVASVGDPKSFRSGRSFSAWIVGAKAALERRP